MRKTTMLALTVAFAMLAPAWAKELAGVSMPDTITVGGKALALNGLGLREATFLKIDVYVAGLYLERTASDPEAILASGETKQLKMHFLRGVSRKDVVGSWKEGVTKNAGAAAGAVQDRFEKLYAAMTDVAEGDDLILTEVPGKGVTATLEGKELVTLAGEDFARVLWSIWLGKSPPNPELKLGLLGKLP
jgi:hypothetical protein